MNLERARIFRLVETADNFVKYAPPGREHRAADRARQRYERALALAERTGDDDLIEQVRLRMQDLERRAALPTGESDDSGDDARSDAVTAEPPPHAERRVPPGQRVTRGWPVLHEGPIPRFDPASWRLSFHGACTRPYELTYEQLKALPNSDLRSDFHCVTGWSKLDNLWRGVQTSLLLKKAEPHPDASYVLVHAEYDYTANLALDTLLADDAMVAWAPNMQDLAPRHGFPLRLLVPKLYGWKSVKWVRSFELLTQDQRGFWELRGYHNHADPWREERYSYQEG